jgi:hypothetical protein
VCLDIILVHTTFHDDLFGIQITLTTNSVATIFVLLKRDLRLDLFKGPNRVRVSPHLRTETDPVSETSCFSSNYLESGRWTKSENPVKSSMFVKLTLQSVAGYLWNLVHVIFDSQYENALDDKVEKKFYAESGRA